VNHNQLISKIARGALRLLFGASWWALQRAAPMLDRYATNPAETASCTAAARKPT
jgi:hypothetical protein